jgi:LSD1 subclass zinc finger protein
MLKALLTYISGAIAICCALCLLVLLIGQPDIVNTNEPLLQCLFAGLVVFAVVGCVLYATLSHED